MSEKFQKIVNAPHKFAGRVRKNISQLHPEKDSGKVAQAGGIIVSGMIQFLLWLGTRIALDNKLTRAGEEYLAKIKPTENPKHKNVRAVQSTIKKHPNLSAHLAYYALLGTLAFGGNGVYNMKQSDKESGTESIFRKPKSYAEIIKTLKIKPTSTYSEFKEMCKPMTPLLIGFMSCPEGFRPNVYLDGRGKPTIGYGSTMIPNGKTGISVTRKTKSVNREQAYEYARWHIEDYETDLILYCYCVALNKTMTASEYLGLASFLYNGGAKMFEPDDNAKNNRIRNDRWTLMLNQIRDNGDISQQEVLDYFEKYPVVSEGSVMGAWRDGQSLDIVGNNMTNYLKAGNGRNRGLHWRRWIEACILTGRISPLDLINCPVGGIYEFQQYMEKVHGESLIDRDARTVNYDLADDFLEWLQHPQYWDKRHKRLYTPSKNLPTIKSILPDEVAEKLTTKSKATIFAIGDILVNQNIDVPLNYAMNDINNNMGK